MTFTFKVLNLLTILLYYLPSGDSLFKDNSEALLDLNNVTYSLNGVAVSDVDNDGDFEWIISGYDGANLILKLQEGQFVNLAQINSPYEDIRDVTGAARGVCACDIDGDGREEIYFLNSNHRYSGPKTYRDRMFKWRHGKYVDLFSDEINVDLPMFDGRSVACLDRNGDGKYGFLLATYANGYGESLILYEMDSLHRRNNVSKGEIVLINTAFHIGLNYSTGGVGVAVGPIVSGYGMSDVFITTEGNTRKGNTGNNALFQNLNGQKYMDITSPEVADSNNDGRGVSLADLNNDGLIDIVYGNWLGPHRIFLQHTNSSGGVRFQNVAVEQFEQSSPVTSVITVDFDNDGHSEIFLGNVHYSPANPGSMISSNRLFVVVDVDGTSVNVTEISVGDAEERERSTSGAAVGDIDGDGLLELLISHNDINTPSLSLYKLKEENDNHWIRFLPLTSFGAPARGSMVALTLSDLSVQSKIIDSGSGYMSQMEPVAHFGLGDLLPILVSITWPGGRQLKRGLSSKDMNTMFTITSTGIMTARSKNNLKSNSSVLNGSVSTMESQNTRVAVTFAILLFFVIKVNGI